MVERNWGYVVGIGGARTIDNLVVDNIPREVRLRWRVRVLPSREPPPPGCDQGSQSLLSETCRHLQLVIVFLSIAIVHLSTIRPTTGPVLSAISQILGTSSVAIELGSGIVVHCDLSLRGLRDGSLTTGHRQSGVHSRVSSDVLTGETRPVRVIGGEDRRIGVQQLSQEATPRPGRAVEAFDAPNSGDAFRQVRVRLSWEFGEHLLIATLPFVLLDSFSCPASRFILHLLPILSSALLVRFYRGFFVLDLTDVFGSPFGVIGVLSFKLGVGRGVVILRDDPSTLGLSDGGFLLDGRCLRRMLEIDLVIGG